MDYNITLLQSQLKCKTTIYYFIAKKRQFIVAKFRYEHNVEYS